MKNIFKLLFNIVLFGMVAMFFAPTASAALASTGLLFTASVLTPQIDGALMMSTPKTNVDAIAKWAGKYSKSLIAQVLNGLDVFKDLTVDRNVSRQGKLLPKITFAAGARPLDYYLENTPANQRSIGGRKLFVYDAMKLFEIIPGELNESFMSDMLAPGAKDIPMAQWFWQKEGEKLGQEINDNFYNQIYKGDALMWSNAATYTANTSYVRFGTDRDYYLCISNTSAGESPTTHPAKWQMVNHRVQYDGLGTIIANEITAGNITPINTGAVTTSNALNLIEQMYDAMTVAHRNAGGAILVSPDVYAKYLKHEKTVYPQALDQNMGDGKKYVYGSGKKWEIKECSWMGTSQRIIVNMKNSNLVVGTNLVENPGVDKTVETLHGYKAVGKWLMGSQIADLEVLYVNNQA